MSAFDNSGLPVPATGEIFDAFAALVKLAGERPEPAGLGGCLIAIFDLDAAGIAALIAGCVAGAAVMGIDAQRERLKQLLRHGICDFVVNDLDEAVRILKNEVRKRQPVSVCLSAEPEAIAREMVERGLQPELLAGQAVAGGDVLRERGAACLESIAGEGTLYGWTLRDSAAALAAGPVLTQVDELAALALDASAETTPWRHRWLQRAPRYMDRRLAAQRCVRMSEDEAARLLDALRNDEALAAQVIVLRDGVPISL